MKFDVPPVVINKLFADGYEEQIVDMVMLCENMQDREVSDLPISPTIMRNNDEKVVLSSQVYELYTKLVQRINHSQTAQEVPFILLGNRREINGEQYIIIENIDIDFSNAISETSVTDDEQKVRNYLSTNQYSVISIGHTHGNVDEKLKEKTLARILPEGLKEKYEIRDTGLNISVADIWQHEAFIQIGKEINPSKEVLQTVIMYNGDMIMISPNNITKSDNIQAMLRDGNYVEVSTAKTVKMTNKHSR